MKIIVLNSIELMKFGKDITLAGAIYEGEDQVLLCPFPHRHIDSDKSILQMNLDEWKKFLRQSDIVEVEVKLEGNQKAIARKSSRMIEKHLVWRVYRRDNYTCRYCGKNEVPLTVDHIDLWENMGASVEENLLSTCGPCNRIRGSILYDEWIESPRYKQLSAGLTPEQKLANIELVGRLEFLKNLRRKKLKSR